MNSANGARRVTSTVADPRFQARLRRRYASERRFQWIGRIALALGGAFLALILGTIVANGYTAWQQTFIALEIHFDPERLDPEGSGSEDVLLAGDYGGLVKAALRKAFPEVRKRRERRKLQAIVSPGASFYLRDMVLENPSLVGETRIVWLPADDDVDMLFKGHIDRSAPEGSRRLSDRQLGIVDALAARGAVEKRFNRAFFLAGDSREPEISGIRGALVGSALTLLVTLLLSFPVGVGAALYLEEFAPRNRWTDLIEVNINNLAAVPSIVFGLLGLAVFLNFFGLPRSVPMVGGMVLALMTLPTIIIAGRAALASVPALDPGGRARGRGVTDADGHPPRAAPRDARDPHRHHHRDGARPRRNGSAADDRDGRVHRGHPAYSIRPRHGAPGADFPVGRQSGTGLRRADLRRDHRAPRIPDRHERPRGGAAAAVRAALVAGSR